MLVGSIGAGRRRALAGASCRDCPRSSPAPSLVGRRVHAVPGRRAERDRRNGRAVASARTTSACSRSAIRSPDSAGRSSPASRSTTSGIAATFAVLALLPLVPVAVLAAGRLALPGPHPARAARRAGQRARTAAPSQQLRRVFVDQRAARDGLGPAHDRDPDLRRARSACRRRRSASSSRRSPPRRSSCASRCAGSCAARPSTRC